LLAVPLANVERVELCGLELAFMSFREPRGAIFFRLKPDLAGFEVFLRSIKVFPGEPEE